MTWRILQAPERWILVSVLLEEPDKRPGVEFFVTPRRSSSQRARPMFIVVDSIAHLDPGVLDIAGHITQIRDRPCRPLATRCRVWTTTRRGLVTTTAF